jgi:hypothetical protein
MGAVFVDQGTDKGGALPEALVEQAITERGPVNVGWEQTLTGNKGLTRHQLMKTGQEGFGRPVL